MMISRERQKRSADDVALSSRDAADLESCLLPNKLEADQLLAANEGNCPSSVRSSQSHSLWDFGQGKVQRKSSD
jgi:hypothetical protein